MTKRVAVIRTSDRIAFKSCRRKWDFSSHLRQNLGPIQTGDPLWLGSGVHFALEDFHSVNAYKSPDIAFQAFALAYNKKYPKKVPDDWEELCKLACEMMQYYKVWLIGRDPLKTYIHNGVPQVEVSVKIPIPIDALRNADVIRQHWDEIIYSLTFDRVSIDEHGALWLNEYKTAKQMATQHFLLDPQISAYLWAMEMYYDKPVGGVVYQQHKKALPKPGRLLNNGSISTAQHQATTHRMYRQTLINKYGEQSSKWPQENVQYLNNLARQENEHADAFVRRDFITRNQHTGKSLAQHVLMEVADMLDPALQIYPNPGRMCTMMCSFEGPCVSKDDGGDWQEDLRLGYEERPRDYDEWRECLPDPKTFTGLKLFKDLNIMEGI